MQTFKRILLTGGGTAGHVNPALAIGSALSGAETRILYINDDLSAVMCKLF